MKKVFFAVFAAVATGTAFAGERAIKELSLSVPLSRVEAVSFEIPKAGYSFADNPNFDKCYALYHQRQSSGYSADKCTRKTPGFSFINNPNFDKCYAIYSKDTDDTTGAIETCIEKTRIFSFADNPNFDKCYRLYLQNQTSGYSADKCIDKSL